MCLGILIAARFTTGYVRLVGQEPAPGKCVLLSTGISGLSSLMSVIWVGIWTLLFCGWSSTLAARGRLAISRLVLIFALPLDFHGRVRVVRSMHLPAALHGVEASSCL